MATANEAAGSGVLKDKRGFTLLELIVVMLITGVLLTIAMFSYRNVQRNYDVERQVKQLHTDVMNARLRAMQHDRNHFVSLASTTMYRIYEDGPPPDGDDKFDAATDSLISTQNLLPSYSMVMVSSPALTLVRFSSKGLVSENTPTGTIRINPTGDGEYDCIVIDQTKTGMGKMNGANCEVK